MLGNFCHDYRSLGVYVTITIGEGCRESEDRICWEVYVLIIGAGRDRYDYDRGANGGRAGAEYVGRSMLRLSEPGRGAVWARRKFGKLIHIHRARANFFLF